MFVLKFMIGIVVLITISLNFFRLIRVDGISPNNKLFNVLVFLLILIFLFQFGLNFTMHRTVMSKLGYPGEPGIRGQTGDKGDSGTCVSDCGRKVCSTVLERDAHNALTFYVKKVRNNLNDGEQLERTLVKCVKGPIVEKGENTVVTLPKVDLDVCKKKDTKLGENPKSTSDELVDCVSVEEVSDSVFGNDQLEIRYRIKNRLFLNKLKLICNSKQYLSTLEKEHKNKPTEKKLIEYLSSIIIKWVELISSFKFNIEKNEVNEETGQTTKVSKTIYIGIIFLMSPDAEFDIIENKKFKQGGIDKIIESPLREIEKYDIWHWGETTTDSPLVVTSCLAKQKPPLAIQQKLKTIYTNNYDIIFDSSNAYPKDVWDATNCPYGQMGKNNDNPNNLKVCVRKSDNHVIKRELAWKETEYRRKVDITFLHPKKYIDKNNKKYYPLGTVWTSLKPNKDGKYGKKTLLVTGDILPPVDYLELWSSRDTLGDNRPIFNSNVNITFWRPKPPKGYVALGDIVVNGTEKPPIDLENTPVVCVAESCVSQIPLGTEIWNTHHIGRVDYRTEENYRIYNNLDLGIETDLQQSRTIRDNYGNLRQCNDGYNFKSYINKNNLMWWACGENCAGGKYLTDGVCNCACEKKEPAKFNPTADNTTDRDKDDNFNYPNNL